MNNRCEKLQPQHDSGTSFPDPLSLSVIMKQQLRPYVQITPLYQSVSLLPNGSG